MYRCIKQIILLFFANMLLLNTAYGQIEWFPIGTEWYYERLSLGEYSTFRFFVEKDTMVDGKACKLIRGESGNEIVYEENGNVYYYFNKNFRKIFAFDVNIGDIIEFEFKTMKKTNSFDLDTTIVLPCRIENIATKIIDGMELREISTFYEYHEDNIHGMSDDFRHEYLEKIGVESNHIMEGIFPVMPNYATVTEGYYKMRCYNDFQINYVTDWWQSIAGDKPCDYAGPVSVNGKNNFNPTVTLFPNPVTNILNIEMPENVKIKSIHIYSMDGRHIEKNRYFFGAGQLNISGLKEGSYILHLETDRGSFNKLIIKK